MQEELCCLRGAITMMAKDQQGLRRVGELFYGNLWPLRKWKQFCTSYLRKNKFRSLPNVNQPRGIYPRKPSRGLNNGNLWDRHLQPD